MLFTTSLFKLEALSRCSWEVKLLLPKNSLKHILLIIQKYCQLLKNWFSKRLKSNALFTEHLKMKWAQDLCSSAISWIEIMWSLCCVFGRDVKKHWYTRISQCETIDSLKRCVNILSIVYMVTVALCCFWSSNQLFCFRCRSTMMWILKEIGNTNTGATVKCICAYDCVFLRRKKPRCITLLKVSQCTTVYIITPLWDMYCSIQ